MLRIIMQYSLVKLVVDGVAAQKEIISYQNKVPSAELKYRRK